MKDPYHFKIERKPQPPPPPDFFCVACRQTISPSMYPFKAEETSPICQICVRHWGSGFGYNVSGVCRTDRMRMQKLAALINLIDWSVKNAKYEY